MLGVRFFVQPAISNQSVSDRSRVMFYEANRLLRGIRMIKVLIPRSRAFFLQFIQNK